MYEDKVSEIKIRNVKQETLRSNVTGKHDSLNQKCYRYRRATLSSYSDIKQSNVHMRQNKTKKYRRINSVVLPTKFLLGGNITDPLNLKGLENEELEFTPPSSPLKDTTQEVLIPPNIYDPLNLTTGEEILFSPSKSRRRKRKRRHTTSLDNSNSFHTESGSESCVPEEKKIDISNDNKEEVIVNSKEKKSCHCASQWVESKRKADKIVSPVVPQGDRKFFRRLNFKVAARKPEIVETYVDKRNWKFSRKKEKPKVYRTHCAQLCYGSYPQHLNIDCQDSRFKYFDKSMFLGKSVLDIGCNVGHVSIHVAKHLEAKHVTGVDIDSYVINIAQKHLSKHLQSTNSKSDNFPISMSLCYGPIPGLLNVDVDSSSFPHNVTFVHGNYVLGSDEDLQVQHYSYDIILCLRVTKWIHLNFGDDGLKRSFKRMFAQLRYGGQLLLEPQPWASYAKAKNLNATISQNYSNIQLKPEHFIEYLTSEDVGFTTCTVIGRLLRNSKGIKQQRSLYLLTKGIASNDDIQQPVTISSVVYNDAEWADRVDEEHDSCCDWDYTVISGDNSSNDCTLPSENNDNSHYDVYPASQSFLDDYNFFPTYDDPTDTFKD